MTLELGNVNSRLGISGIRVFIVDFIKGLTHMNTVDCLPLVCSMLSRVPPET
jgi:hypothetical protein